MPERDSDPSAGGAAEPPAGGAAEPPAGGAADPPAGGFRSALRAALDAADRDDARAVWHALGAAGVTAALYPVRDCGRQPDPRRLATLLSELDARCPLGVTLSVCVQVATVVPLLSDSDGGGGPPGGGPPGGGPPGGGPPGHAAAALRGMLRGETMVALAVTDAAGSGSALLDADTRAKMGDGTVAVRGGKEWITNATTCDLALVLARHREPRHFTSFCWVLVPATAPGVTIEPAGRAFAGSGVGHLRFDGVVLDAAAVVGRPGRALAGFARQAGVERLAGALWSRAMCRRLLVGLGDWLRHRPAAGGTLWDHPAVRERYARCLVLLHQLETACAPLLAAPAGPPAAATGMVLKVTAAETVERILAEAVHLRGADAFRDGGEAQLRSEAAMFGIAGGATGAMLAGIAEHADELLRDES